MFKSPTPILAFCFLLIILTLPLNGQIAKKESEESVQTDRTYWVNLLYKISYPVVHSLANDDLKKQMPLEKAPGYNLPIEKVTYLEAVGRTLSGLAPWLTLPDDNSEESKLRQKLKADALKGLAHAVDPKSKDFLNFATESQPIVDAAFLAQAFLRAPKQLWEPLDSLTKQRFIEAFKSLRNRKAVYSNWLLFSAETEVFLLSIGESYDPVRIDYAYHKFKDWYVGDGWYKDGEQFAMDYYNAFVIHPMLVDILKVMTDKKLLPTSDYDVALKRMVRYAEFQERLISPEGTFPIFGRSMAYRAGALQALAQVSCMNQLPENIQPAQVRCAMTLVMQNMFEAQGTFNNNGWLQLGFVGHQPEICDTYTSTGSLYLCTEGFLALGLPPTNRFWSDQPSEWTAKKGWSGKTVKKDHKID